MVKPLGRAAIALLLLLPTTVPGQVEREFENYLLQQLAQVQRKSGGLAPFTTDGCSGGLSAGWRSLSRVLPGFRDRYGVKPPWEHCCVEHDRVYWRGETEDGYDKRKAADLALRQCVVDTGRRLKPQLVAQYAVEAEAVSDAFLTAAELMYGAVRVGGLPCTPLPWRWGYGWPPCPMVEQ